MEFNQEKFSELILHFADKSRYDPNFGAIKLNKLLFLSHFISYGLNGAPITGETYVHFPKGPVPRNLVRSRDELISQGYAELREVYRFGYKQQRLIAKRGVNESLFSAAEIDAAGEALSLLKDFNAAQASDLTHRWNCWLLTRQNENIPYESFFVRELDNIGLEDFEWAKKLETKAA